MAGTLTIPEGFEIETQPKLSNQLAIPEGFEIEQEPTIETPLFSQETPIGPEIDIPVEPDKTASQTNVPVAMQEQVGVPAQDVDPTEPPKGEYWLSRPQKIGVLERIKGEFGQPLAAFRAVPFKAGMEHVYNKALEDAKKRQVDGDYTKLADKQLEDYWGQQGIYNPESQFGKKRDVLVRELAGFFETEDSRLIEKSTAWDKEVADRGMTMNAKTLGAVPGLAQDITRTLTELKGIGGVIEKTGVGTKIIDSLVKKYGVQAIPWAMRAARMVQTGATFAAREGVDKALKGTLERDLSSDDVLDVIKAGGFGVGLGAVGSIPKAMARIPAESLFGYVTAKINGASNEEAAGNAVIFGLFGLLNRADLSKQYKQAVMQHIEGEFVKKAGEFGISKNLAKYEYEQYVTKSAVKATGINDPAKAMDAVLNSPKANMKYWQEIEKRIASIKKVVPRGTQAGAGPEPVKQLQPSPGTQGAAVATQKQPIAPEGVQVPPVPVEAVQGQIEAPVTPVKESVVPPDATRSLPASTEVPVESRPAQEGPKPLEVPYPEVKTPYISKASEKKAMEVWSDAVEMAKESGNVPGSKKIAKRLGVKIPIAETLNRRLKQVKADLVPEIATASGRKTVDVLADAQANMKQIEGYNSELQNIAKGGDKTGRTPKTDKTGTVVGTAVLQKYVDEYEGMNLQSADSLNSIVKKLKKGNTKLTPKQFDLLDTVISRLKKQGEGEITAETSLDEQKFIAKKQGESQINESEMEPDDLILKNGEWFKVETGPDGTQLKDGETISLNFDEDTKAGLVVKKGDPKYAEALDEYKKQLKKETKPVQPGKKEEGPAGKTDLSTPLAETGTPDKIAIVRKALPDYDPKNKLRSIEQREELKVDIGRLRAKLKFSSGTTRSIQLGLVGEKTRALDAMEIDEALAKENASRPLSIGDKVITSFNDVGAVDKPYTVKKVNPKTVRVVSFNGVESMLPRSSVTLTEKPSLKLESVSKEQLESEKAKSARKEEIAKLQAKPIEGKSVDTTGDLFDADKSEAPLFAVPTPKAKAKRAEEPKVVAEKPKPVTEPEAKEVPLTKALQDGTETKPPKLATVVRVTDSKGREAILPVKDMDSLIGAGPFKTAEFGTIGKKLGFQPITKSGEARADRGEIEDTPEFARQRGFKNMSGAVGFTPQKRIQPKGSDPALEAQKILDRQEKDAEAYAKKKKGKILDKLAKHIVDVNAPIRRLLAENSLGDSAMINLELSRGASAEALRQWEADEKRISKGLPHESEKLFAGYLQFMRTIEVSNLKKEQQKQLEAFPEFEAEGIKSPTTVEQSRAWINALKEQDPKAFALIEKAARKYWGAMHRQVRALHREGIISSSQRDFLLTVHKYYSPRLFLHHIDTADTGVQGGGKISVTDSGIKALGEGSDKSLVDNWRLLLANVVARTQTRIFKNRANVALGQYVKSTDKNAINAVIEKPIGMNKDGSPKYKDIPADMERVSYWQDGKIVNILMPADVAESWVTSDPKLLSQIADIFGWISGAKIVKPFATGLNPEFAVANIPRDVIHSLFTTKEYSPVLPLAWAQQAKDFATVSKDVFTGGKRVRDYIKQGGGMDFLTDQGFGGKEKILDRATTTGESISQIRKIMGWAGEKSELWTRIALRERAIKNGATPKEATHIARTYIDFAQGGSTIKVADKAIPYLNAGVQGTRGIFRAFKKNPAMAAFKVAQVLAISLGFAYWNRKRNKEAWESISDKEKTTKWIITTPWSWTDKDGRKRWIYFTIPKDQGQRLFAAIGEELSEKWITGHADSSRIIDATTDFLPVSTPISPTLSAFMGYMNNKDFWTKEDVWKGRNVSPEQEYWNRTPKPAVLWGKVTGMSPERSKMAFNKVVPYNPYTWMMGAMWDQFTPGDKDTNETFVGQLTRLPFARRIIRSTWPVDLSKEDATQAKKFGVQTREKSGKPISPRKIRKELEKAEISRNDIRQTNDRKYDEFRNASILANPREQIKVNREWREWLSGIGKKERDRLKVRSKRQNNKRR